MNLSAVIDVSLLDTVAQQSALTPIFTWWFWEEFLPNFASTVIGAFLGVIGALHVNKRSARDDERRGSLVTTLGAVLSHNRKELDEMVQEPEDVVPFFLDLRIEAWDALKPEVVALVRSTSLKGDLASHFEDLRRLELAITERRGRLMDRTPFYGSSAAQKADARERVIQTSLRGRMSQASAAAVRLQEDLAQRA